MAWEQELWDEFSSESFVYNQAQTDPRKKIHSPVVGIVGMLRSEKLGKDDKLWHEDDFVPMSKEEQDAYIANLAKHSTDWFDVLFRNSFSMNHHLSFSGGSNQYTYYVSLGVTDDRGLVKETDYQRYNLNAKVDLNPSDRLNLGFGIDLSKQKSDSYSMTVSPFEYAYFANPYETLYNPDGSYRSDRTYFNLAGINDGNLSDGVQPPSGFNIMREMKETSSSADNTSASVRMNLGYDIIEKLRISGLVSYTYLTSPK